MRILKAFFSIHLGRVLRISVIFGTLLWNIVRNWLVGFVLDLAGKRGYTVIALLLSAYFGLYLIYEAAHDRQMNRATFERSMLLSMVSAANRAQFIAAMKNFGTIQAMSIVAEPQLAGPLSWGSKIMPNYEPLHKWAKYSLSECRETTCGVTIAKNSNTASGNYRIDLYGAILRGAYLRCSDLQNSRLTESDMREANLSFSNLKGSDLGFVNLGRANLEHANLEGVNWELVLSSFFDPKLDQANLNGTNLRGAKGLTCDVLRTGNNWERSCRDEALLCGGRENERVDACKAFENIDAIDCLDTRGTE